MQGPGGCSSSLRRRPSPRGIAELLGAVVKTELVHLQVVLGAERLLEPASPRWDPALGLVSLQTS